MLPDQARCRGDGCPIRTTCARFVELDSASRHTPMYGRRAEAVGYCPMFKAAQVQGQGVKTLNPVGV